MPKRKKEDYNGVDYERMANKIRKLERKMKRARKRRRRSSTSSSSDKQSPRYSSESKSVTNTEYDQFEYMNESPPQQDERCRQPLRSVVCSIPQLVHTVADIHDSPTHVTDVPPPSTIDASLLATQPILPAAAPSMNMGDTLVLDSEAGPSTLSDLRNAELDTDIMDILGEDPTNSNEYGPEIQKDLAIRLSHIVTSGLSKENRKELKGKYLIPSNCKLMKSPSLNPEIRASLTESQIKRDKGIEYKQTMTSCALSSISHAITMLLNSENKNPELLKLLMDTARIVGDIQHSDSTSRRFFILSNIKKEIKDQLEKTDINEMLFGSNLSETIRSAKIISKSGADIRSVSTPKPVTRTPTRPLNYRPPPATRGPPAVGASRGPRLPPPSQRPTTTTRPTQHSAYRTSSRQQYTRYRR